TQTLNLGFGEELRALLLTEHVPNMVPCPHLTLKPRSVGVACLLAAFISLAALGNALVILSVLYNRQLQTATNFFTGNLALADLLLSVCVLPFSATLEVLGCWPFGRAFCDVWAALDVLCCTASILSVCAIAVDRYVAVRHSLHYRIMVTRGRAAVALAFIWAVCAGLSVPPLLGWKEVPPNDTSVCTVTQEPGYALFSSLLSFYLPLAVVLAVYSQVYVVVRRTTLSLQTGVKRHRDYGDGATEVVLRIHRRGALVMDERGRSRRAHTRWLLRFSREKKAAKNLAVVVGIFILCWLPFFLILPLGSVFPALRPSEVVFKVVFWLGYSNSCINPFIYPCSNLEFRRAFSRLLRFPRHRRAPQHSSLSGSTRELSRGQQPNLRNSLFLQMKDDDIMSSVWGLYLAQGDLGCTLADWGLNPPPLPHTLVYYKKNLF
uniref:G-protein coupled receptors family 1 profile domain-containing protein n=1 Tax=Denticeps clupeoides TaxID=299321 RepID=A0AAY4BCG0_9TELE